MGTIQNSINQALGAVGIAARLSPELERKQKLKDLSQKHDQVTNLLEKTDFKEETVQELTEEQVQLSKEIAKLNPTKENVFVYETEAEGLSEMRKEPPLVQVADMANNRSEELVQSKQIQMERIKGWRDQHEAKRKIEQIEKQLKKQLKEVNNGTRKK